MTPTDTAFPLALKLVTGFEGCSLTPYQDVGGVWTIGYGCTRTPAGKPVTAATPALASKDEALAWASPLVADTLEKVRGMCQPLLTDNEAAALTSFAYNEGLEALANSTLLKLFNEGKILEAAQQFRRWVFITKDGSLTRVQGLVNRRNLERRVFLLGETVNG